MSKQQRVVLIIGSPKSRGGTSRSIGEYILNKLPGKEFQAKSYHVGKALKKKEDWLKFTSAVSGADTIILSFPLYWDSMPSHLIKVFERLYSERKKITGKNPQKFYLIVNNGFPEPWHNEIAIDIGRRFALRWAFRGVERSMWEVAV